MIVSRLSGRLGNQLFQYALGKSLAHHHKVPLYLDSHSLKVTPLAFYALPPFQIEERLLTPEQIEKGLQKRSFGRRPKLKFIREKARLFSPAILKVPKNVYLYGWWQSEKYFKPIESIIRSEFQLRMPQEGRNLELAQEISTCNAISIHIRRGDYISNPKAAHLGVCSVAYYNRAVEEIAKGVDDPRFYIFTDDPEWARSEFKIPYPTKVIDHNLDCGYEDLRLMSQCKHHIIANSSFSWWGAYLNPDSNKRVIAPAQWNCTDEANAQCADMTPDSWIRL